MFKNLRKKKKGFTLIELIIVIAIIGVLAVVAIPKFGNASKNAKTNAELANAKNIANAATMAIAEGEALNATTAIPVTESLLGKYLQGIPQTAAKGSFYIKVDTDGKVTVYSDDGKTVVYPAPAS